MRKYTGMDLITGTNPYFPYCQLIFFFRYFNITYMCRLIPGHCQDLYVFPKLVTPWFRLLTWYIYMFLFPIDDGWMTCDFTSFSTVFQSYQADDNERLCATEPCLRLKGPSFQARFELMTTRLVGQRLTH